MAGKTATTFNTLGTIERDNNRIPIGWGNQFITQDGAATPVKSPLVSVSASTPATITIPQGATQVTLIAAVAMRVSELSNLASYAVIPANTPVTLDVTTQPNLYVQSDSTAGNLSFIFSGL